MTALALAVALTPAKVIDRRSAAAPKRAQLIVVASKPVLYLEWTPSRIAVWDRPGCST